MSAWAHRRKHFLPIVELCSGEKNRPMNTWIKKNNNFITVDRCKLPYSRAYFLNGRMINDIKFILFNKLSIQPVYIHRRSYPHNLISINPHAALSFCMPSLFGAVLGLISVIENIYAENSCMSSCLLPLNFLNSHPSLGGGGRGR